MQDSDRQSQEFRATFLRSLFVDVVSAMQRRREQDSQSQSRELVRTLFAAIEGLTWTYRRQILSMAETAYILTPAEIAAFAEKSYFVTDNGKVVEQDRFMSMRATIRLTTNVALRLDPKIGARFDTNDWRRFGQALVIRHRVTHPKDDSDLFVSDEDIELCYAAFDWLFSLCVDALERATAAFKRDGAQMRDLLDKLKAGDPAAIAEYKIAAANLGLE